MMKPLAAMEKFILKFEKKGFEKAQRRTLKHGRRILLWKEESGFFSTNQTAVYLYHVTGTCSADSLREAFRDYARIYEKHDFDEGDKGFFVCSDDVDPKLFRDIRKAVIDDADIRRNIKLQKIKESSIQGKTTSKRVKRSSSSKKPTSCLSSEQTERLIHSVGTRCSYPNCKEMVSLDVHHIKPREEGGSNRRTNLIVLCPTHHRLADRGAIPKKRLKLYSVSKMEMGRKNT